MKPTTQQLQPFSIEINENVQEVELPPTPSTQLLKPLSTKAVETTLIEMETRRKEKEIYSDYEETIGKMTNIMERAKGAGPSTELVPPLSTRVPEMTVRTDLERITMTEEIAVDPSIHVVRPLSIREMETIEIDMENSPKADATPLSEQLRQLRRQLSIESSDKTPSPIRDPDTTSVSTRMRVNVR